MKKWLTLHFRVILCMAMVWISLNRSIAQCNPPEQLPTPMCEDAPLICLLNACYETLGIPNGGPSGWCNGSNTIENPQYFLIIPTQPTIEIHIHVDNCDSGTSLQAGIMAECPWGVEDVLACNGGTSPGGTIILQATGLNPGVPYWLMFDGSSGALCDYTITYVDGIYGPGFEGELESAEAIPSSVCQGFDSLILVANPPIQFAHGYYWALGWSGDTVTSTLPTTSVEIPADLEPGIYEICVGAFSGCDMTEQELCFEVEVYDLPPAEREPVILCPEEFPITWGPLEIDGPGEYERSFYPPEGCTFDSTWVVESYPEPETGIIDTFHCLPLGELTFFYENEPYEASGTYSLSYPNADINGCDSMAELNIFMIGLDAFAEVTCDNGEFVLTAFIQEMIPFSADVDFNWYDHAGGPLLAEGNPFMTLLPGCYDLYIRVITSEGSCEYFIETICIDGDEYLPPPPYIPDIGTAICAQDNVFICVEPDPFGEPNLEYVWEAPDNVPLFQDGSECVEMDLSFYTGGDICVYSIGECGVGPTTCFEVDILQPPVATFSFEPSVCVNEISTITFTGIASSNAEVIWDFNSPSSITGSGIGPYDLSWTNPGVKTISLSIIEPGCDTSSTSVDVMVDILPAPVINCSSTIHSIEFDWEDISGAVGYLISLNGGLTVPVTESDTSLTMLTPGSSVELILTALSGGPCPNTMDTLTCTAQNCPAPVIELTGEDSICLNAPTIVNLEALVNGSPGTGTWNGTGITDGIEGLFDPVMAGPGVHQLTYAVLENGCPFNQSFTISVFDSLIAEFSIDTLICISDMAHIQYTGNASANAIYNFEFGGATIEAGSGSGPFQLSWNSQGLQDVRLQVEENGCVSDVFSQSVDVVAELIAPVVACAPTTSSVLFSWTLDPAAAGNLINVLSGHSGINNGNTFTFDGMTAGDIVQIEIVSQSNGPCPERRDTFQCEARACPSVEFDLTPIDDICLYPGTGNIQLEVIITNGNGIGEWLGSGIIDAAIGWFSPTVAGVGSHLITYHYTEDGCDFFEPLAIDVYEVPDAFVSNTDLQITCTNGSIFLNGSSSAGDSLSFLWSTINGSIAGSANESIAEAVKPGLYQLLISNTVSGCKDSTTVTVTQDSNIPTADAGPDKVLTCDSTLFTIGGNSSTGLNIIYSWSTLGGNITGDPGTMITQANQTGDYTLVVQDTVSGCQSQDNVKIDIDTFVSIITLFPGDTIDCNTVVTQVTSDLGEPIDDYTFEWTTIDGLITGSISDPDVEVSQGGTYQLTIHNVRNGCQRSEEVLVAESDEIIDAVQVEQENISCFGFNDGSLLVLDVDGGTPDYAYAWSGSTNGNPGISSLSPGEYSLTVSDANGCYFEKSFVILEPAKVLIDLGPDQTVVLDELVNIDLNTSVPGSAISSITWSAYNGMFCPGCTTFEIIASYSATITAIIADTSGCVAADSMKLKVIVPKIIFVPTIFSPDGDGINDYFTISGKRNLINIASLRIYDRWGNQLFEGVDLEPGNGSLGWDGTFNGKSMQPGVYVFTAKLEYDTSSETIWGNITLMK